MTQMNQYIFNLYHFILNVRDTMEYALDKEHDIKVFEQRKRVITEELLEGHAFGNFLINNGEAGEKLKARVEEFIQDYYAEGNTILTPAGEKVRVDHTQNIKILTGVIALSNTLRDILAQYLNAARQQKDTDPLIMQLVVNDERMFRIVFATLVMKEFQKSFAEFQKVMEESKGAPTPQSNFIIQNELFVLARAFRDSRAAIHVTDNETLDLLDECIELIEMTEGRRDRRDNKPFSEFFNSVSTKLSAAIAKIEPLWKQSYDTTVQVVISQANAQQENNNENLN